MKDRETVDVYSRKAEVYADLPMTQEQTDALDMFTAGLAPGAHILDLGCGPGIHTLELMQRGFSACAIDATPAFVDAARARGVDAHFGTFDDLTEEDAYDGIWASFSLLHAPKADFPRHIAACKRALRDGGCLFLGLKLGEGEHRDDLGRFYAFYTQDELRGILTDAGFDRLQSRTGKGKGLAGTIDPFILLTAHA
ncbi:methyltransferase domain-containing protein [Shimia sp. CNT1-13L.2]|uniref:class I SAM-dependent DNA methyltransferase n=1 Tax=Shimia sp. CNT1-13L.2 TaxID=2959663 RepID=UPI0020CE2CE2|nr:class I SAM-dependent methyltransferase [Shimia sp. CNT1-13L.2]MCP9482338.1 methyltransferase domain-containing protein [Shimia sp. CNT1-13L.2]